MRLKGVSRATTRPALPSEPIRSGDMNAGQLCEAGLGTASAPDLIDFSRLPSDNPGGPRGRAYSG